MWWWESRDGTPVPSGSDTTRLRLGLAWWPLRPGGPTATLPSQAGRQSVVSVVQAARPGQGEVSWRGGSLPPT